jgi:hypothetical protein
VAVIQCLHILPGQIKKAAIYARVFTSDELKSRQVMTSEVDGAALRRLLFQASRIDIVARSRAIHAMV